MKSEELNLSFELIVDDENGEIQNGDIPVRWCVTPQLVKQLKDNHIKDPHILLVTVAKNGIEMQRQLVPMNELMTYVRFTKSGENKLHGFIINAPGGRKDIYAYYLRQGYGKYVSDIINKYDESLKPFPHLLYEQARTEITVDIPEGVFGKEPSAWTKWFVNLWHGRTRVADECDFRQRMILAFTLKWIPVLIYTILGITVRVIITGSLKLMGFFKNVHFFRSFRLFYYNDVEQHLLPDFKFDIINSALIIKRKCLFSKSQVMTPMYMTVPFLPFMLLLQGLFVYFIADQFVATMLTISILFLSVALAMDLLMVIVDCFAYSPIFTKTGSKNAFLGLIISLFGVICLIILYRFTNIEMTLGIGSILLFFTMFIFNDKIIGKFNNINIIPQKSNDYTEIRELLCPKDELNLKPDIKFIPKKQRTIRLRYLDLKNKICKPMQR